MKPSRRVAALITIAVLLVSGSMIALLNISPQVTPPEQPPSGEVESVLSSNLEFVASVYVWQDFLLLEPDEQPPLNLMLRVNVTNLGSTTVFGLNVPMVTLYFGDSLTPLRTFRTSPGLSCCFDEFSVAAGDMEIFQFVNDPEPLFSPDLDEGTILYARVLIEWSPDNETILTTSPVQLDITPRSYGGGPP